MLCREAAATPHWPAPMSDLCGAMSEPLVFELREWDPLYPPRAWDVFYPARVETEWGLRVLGRSQRMDALYGARTLGAGSECPW